MPDTKNKHSNNPQPTPLRESVNYSEESLKERVNGGFTTTVSQRVPITPAPPKPPERNKK